MGFFVSKNLPKKKKKNDNSLDHLLGDLGCKACPLATSSRIQSPNMEPSGSARPTVYVLGESPGKTEDEDNEQFVGDSGQLLRSNLIEFFPKLYRGRRRNKGIRFNNCVRCRTSSSNRDPTNRELTCCRKLVEEDIEKTKPLVIIGCGNIPLKWMLNVSGIGLWRGRRIPVKIGTHEAWFFPISHPAFVLRSEKEIGDVFRRDLSNIADFLSDIDFKDLPEVIIDGHKDNVTYVTGRNENDLRKVRRKLELFCDDPLTAIDVEATCLKPWQKKAKLLTVSISSDRETFSFPVDHPRGWDMEKRKIVKNVLRWFLLNSNTKIAHNLKCEAQWLIDAFGQKVMRETKWADTISRAYVLDERVGVFSLDIQCLIYFGFNLKSICNLDASRLLDYPIEDVLLYNGVDSKWTLGLYKKQEELFCDSLRNPESLHIETSKTLALTEIKGLDIDLDEVDKNSEKLSIELDNITLEISDLPKVRKYEKKYGKFNCASNPSLGVIFKEFYGLSSPKKTKPSKTYPNGQESFDEKVIKLFAEKGNDLAKCILEFRKVSKLKSTYVDSIPKLLCSDKKLRPEFNSTLTATGRLSSSNPNAQNFPKRKNRYVRAVVVAPKGHWFVAFDYCQLEARNLTMVSGETNIIEKDIHADWAERVINLSPEAANTRSLSAISKEDFKAFRGKIKNTLVFPWFYGAGEWSVAEGLGISQTVVEKLSDDFWRLFDKVKKWQEETEKFYYRHGYVETLTGRRRHAPLDRNRRFNSPIQGCSSDIVIDAMNRLSLLAYELSKSQYQARLNVHDDLSFYIPDKTLTEDIEFIAKEMCRPADFMNNIPLEVEVAVGRNWFKLEEIGKFSTTDFDY
jgi:DNA polymerase-1